MLLVRPPLAMMREGRFHSLRVQLSCVLLVGVVLPLSLILARLGLPTLFIRSTISSMVAASAAAIVMVLFLRRIAAYPGTSVGRYILPTLALLYGAILLGDTILRLPYSNAVLLLSFPATLGARYGILIFNSRGVPTYYVVPGGQVGMLRELEYVHLIWMNNPDLVIDRRSVVVADLRHAHEPDWERLLAEQAIAGSAVYHFKQILEAGTGRVQIQHLSENNFGSLIPSLVYCKMKRFLDVAACIALLPLLLPVLAIIALLIRLDSSGPAVFRQKRMGYRGRPFVMYKFRTMVEGGTDDDRDALKTCDGDRRITRMGHFLRRTRLDELPQVFNIMRGQMSWIGPRPEAMELSLWYEAELPFYRYRHMVRPGITGWAQVNQGHVTLVGEVSAKLEYDFYYIKYVSYWLDLLIVSRTLRVVITGFGAR